MTPVTLIMAYYDNPLMLVEHYRFIRQMPDRLREHVNLIIVDDCSPTAPATPSDLDGAALQIYRLRKDVRWNQDACRNIGVKHAETNWVLMTDMDHMVSAAAWETVINRNWDARKAYTFTRVSAPDMTPYKPHPNSWFMHRDTFNAVGGYDERFAGLYGTDGDFQTRLRTRFPFKQIKEPLIRIPRTLIPDASTTSYLRKQPGDFEGIKKLRMKRDRRREGTMRGRFEYDRVF